MKQRFASVLILSSLAAPAFAQKGISHKGPTGKSMGEDRLPAKATTEELGQNYLGGVIRFQNSPNGTYKDMTGEEFGMATSFAKESAGDAEFKSLLNKLKAIQARQALLRSTSVRIESDKNRSEAERNKDLATNRQALSDLQESRRHLMSEAYLIRNRIIETLSNAQRPNVPKKTVAEWKTFVEGVFVVRAESSRVI